MVKSNYSENFSLRSYRHHGILLYKNNHQRNEILASYLNKELKKGHLCIYAPVDPYKVILVYMKSPPKYGIIIKTSKMVIYKLSICNTIMTVPYEEK